MGTKGDGLIACEEVDDSLSLYGAKGDRLSFANGPGATPKEGEGAVSIDEFGALVAPFITGWRWRLPGGGAKPKVEVEYKLQDTRCLTRPCLTGAVSTVMLWRPHARPTSDSVWQDNSREWRSGDLGTYHVQREQRNSNIV